jgi:hypothetical protein
MEQEKFPEIGKKIINAHLEDIAETYHRYIQNIKVDYEAINGIEEDLGYRTVISINSNKKTDIIYTLFLLEETQEWITIKKQGNQDIPVLGKVQEIIKQHGYKLAKQRDNFWEYHPTSAVLSK